MKFILRILLSALSVFITAYLLSGVHLDNYMIALLVAVVLGLLNVSVKPVLIFLTLPATIISLGLFILVINAVVVMLADWFIDGFGVDGFWWALLFALIQWALGSIFSRLLKEEPKKEKKGKITILNK